MTELMEIFVLIAPAAAGVLASVVSVILGIKKIGTTIAEFRQSNELAEDNRIINDLLKDNKQLKKMNERLLVEFTKIKPKEWVDDEQK